MRRRLSVLLATATMVVMLVASSGAALAAPCGDFCGGPPPGSAPLSKGAEKANAKASFGIATAVQNSTKNDGGCGSACE